MHKKALWLPGSRLLWGQALPRKSYTVELFKTREVF